MAKELFEFVKRDGTVLKGLTWMIDSKIKANILIITGMAETAARYDDLARFLNKNGYNVYCLDHFGQGLNAPTVEQLGIWEKSGFRKTVTSIHEFVRKLKISIVPIYILGHSMGSFILQDYIQRFGADINKAIICGSNGPSVKNKLGAPIIRTVARFKGRDYRSKFVHDLAFGGYNKQFKPGRTEFDWLSRDEQQVDLYAADPYCGYMPTVGFYAEFVKGINRLNKHKFLNKVPKDLPILLIAGSKDPVGNNGKGVRKLERIYKKYGMNVTAMLYEDMRHEILNEVGKQQVYDDILSFLQK